MDDPLARAWRPFAVNDGSFTTGGDAPRSHTPPPPHARHPRTFLCRDALWEQLEQIAGELECTVDYLVNDALKHYIRQRLTRRTEPQRDSIPQPAPSYPLTPSGQYQLVPPAPLPPPRAPAPVPPVPPPPLPARMTPPPLPAARTQPVPLPPYPPPPYVPPPPPPAPIARPSFVPAGYAAPPPVPVAPMPEPPPPPPELTVTYAGTIRRVDHPGFVIGRGKASGLVIKDPNISRQHAVVEQQGGLYYLVDMGSVNGTFVNGERITRKAIVEGDVARIADHEVRFSFMPRSPTLPR